MGYGTDIHRYHHIKVGFTNTGVGAQRPELDFNLIIICRLPAYEQHQSRYIIFQAALGTQRE